MTCQKSPPFPEHSFCVCFFFFSLSQIMFLLAHWRNTSFHAHQQQCYPSRCKKGGTEKIKGDFPCRFLSGSACRETCGHPKACKSPCTRQPDRGGTTILSCSQVRDLLSGIKPFFSVILCTRLAEQQIPQKQCLETLGQVLIS